MYIYTYIYMLIDVVCIYIYLKVGVCAKWLQSQLFVALWTVAHHHGILQARILEWVAMPSSSGSSQHQD